mmetsp:Transcript_113898/g.362131  ORF Transcript_113898/g.362131 Transcript_113898/m.362131 type:complete len:214 (-) Transcript_113898:103-744(-)
MHRHARATSPAAAWRRWLRCASRASSWPAPLATRVPRRAGRCWPNYRSEVPMLDPVSEEPLLLLLPGCDEVSRSEPMLLRHDENASIASPVLVARSSQCPGFVAHLAWSIHLRSILLAAVRLANAFFDFSGYVPISGYTPYIGVCPDIGSGLHWQMRVMLGRRRVSLAEVRACLVFGRLRARLRIRKAEPIPQAARAALQGLNSCRGHRFEQG